MEKNDQIKMIRKLNIVRCGKIFSNLSIAFVILMLGSILSFVLMGMFFLLYTCVFLMTLGLLSLFGGLEVFGNANKLVESFGSYFSVASPYLAVGALLCSAISIILLAYVKDKEMIPRIVFSGIVILVAIVGLILYLAGVRL